MEQKLKSQLNSLNYTAVSSEVTSENQQEISSYQQSNQAKQDNGPKLGKRHIQILLFCLLIIFEYFERVSLFIAIVAMTDKSSENPDIPIYDWNNKGVILSSFNWGYIAVQPLSGWLTNRYRPKRLLFVSMLISSVLGFLIPILAAKFGPQGIIVARVFQGLSQSCLYPSISGLLAKWIPPCERTRLISIVFSANSVGIIVSHLLSGFIAASWYGWPIVFYASSTIGVVWCLFYAYFGSNGPDHHTTITEEEKLFIHNGLKHSGVKMCKAPIPWRKMLTSHPARALFVIQTGYALGECTLLTELPTYMSHVMKFDLKSNSLLSSLPYLTKLILAFVCCFISEALERRKVISTAVNRRVFIGVGILSSALAFVCLGNSGPNDAKIAVTLLVIAVGALGALESSFYVNFLDIAPNYFDVMVAFINTSGCCIGIIAPLLVQFVVTDESNPEQWKIIFYLASVVNTAAYVHFLAFSSAELQPWNDGKSREGF